MQDIHSKVIEILSSDNRFVSNGQLLKNIVQESAFSKDTALLTMLAKDEDLRKIFFYEEEDFLIFKQNQFIEFISNKEFLPDSFTKYLNHIGLMGEEGFFRNSNQVQLAWPYKDTVLEGGQENQDDTRSEIFWNVTLAGEQITRLFDPKLFGNFKYFSEGGEKRLPEQRKNIGQNANFVISGNNLLVLHSLKKQYQGKIKFIYIDPPYNTGGTEETFTYHNNFKHSTWLTFMKNRLEVAKTLLRDDGFIGITIDHYELFYLGVLADEIFGRENRIGIVTVVHKPEGRNQEKFFGTSNEFLLVYARNKENANFRKVVIDDEIAKKFNLEDEKGKYRLKNFIRLTDGKYSLRENKPGFYYPIYVSKSLSDFSLDPKPDYIAVYPITDKGVERTWKTKDQTFLSLVENGNIEATKEDDRIVIYEKLRQDQVIKTHWVSPKYHAYHFGTKLLESVLGRKEFSFPKSIHAVKDIIKIITEKDDIILDFFAGSGTTGHAVLELNREDRGNRRFILVEQLPDHLNIIVERISKVMEGEENFYYCELRKWNALFLEKIIAAKKVNELIKIWREILDTGYINYMVNEKNIKTIEQDMSSFTLIQNKEMIKSILDLNHVYVNFADAKENAYDTNDIDIELSQRFFYGNS